MRWSGLTGISNNHHFTFKSSLEFFSANSFSNIIMFLEQLFKIVWSFFASFLSEFFYRWITDSICTRLQCRQNSILLKIQSFIVRVECTKVCSTGKLPSILSWFMFDLFGNWNWRKFIWNKIWGLVHKRWIFLIEIGTGGVKKSLM